MANHVLEILDGDRAGEVVPVAERTLRIGRKPGNDIVLADEKTSGVHAEIVLEGDRHVLRDLASTNGTFLDGKRVNELVLTPGDVVTIGRTRVRFRDASEPALADAGELAVRRLDANRGRSRTGSVGALAAVLVLGLVAAGWFWFQAREGGGDPAAPGARTRDPMAVGGNKLAAAVAACDGEDGWLLRASGVGFQAGAPAHTGLGALRAQRGEAADAPDFAVLRTQEAVPVFAGRSLTLAAHVRTANGASVALRAVLFAANEQVPFAFRTGTAMAAHEGWTRIETTVVVPTGCDRVHAELAAVLPSADAEASVDDVAIVEGGGGVAIDAKVADGPSALGTGQAFAVRSVDTENPAIVLALLPDTVPAALQGLHRAELCVLSDLGATLACTANERGFRVECGGVDSLQWVLPAEAAGGLRAAGADGVFAAFGADAEFVAQSVLVGDRLTRALLRFQAPVACRSRTGGGRYRLFVPAAAADLLVTFREERSRAGELLREAERARDGDRPGDALDRLRELTQQQPMDSTVLAKALALRSELLAAQAARVRELQRDLEQASFFSTRGAFERVVQGVDALEQRYGADNLEDGPASAALRDAARARLAELDAETREQQQQRLLGLEQAFREGEQPGLALLVQRYRERHLGAGTTPPPPPAANGGDGKGG